MDVTNRLQAYQHLRKFAYEGKWAQRILSEMGYLLELSRAHDYVYDQILIPQLKYLKQAYGEQGAITKIAALQVEHTLSQLHALAKSYDVTCVAHAHIDMNWLWGFNETVSITVDTFRTMLKLMEEYPEFVFSQSQASVYRIIEQYAPDLLPQIKARIHEGRWEVTASSWVENDKNMPSGESMARHLLYTRRYLSDLFDIPAHSVKLDFEPDTFGHTAVLPEILQNGGIQYYYHCRGYDKEFIYNWKAPSGASVLVYREPNWYNQTITPDLFLHVPSFCSRYHIQDYLKVYGVGDHGGGPTRRDLNRLIEMNAWPLFPTIHFGTLQSYFDRLAPHKNQFPVVDGELNYVFTGCYTSQSRIKRGNMLSEIRLNEAETLDVMASALSPTFQPAQNFQNAWEKVLFNQFHDILPGSGITETREYAMGTYQEALAAANVNATRAMQAICASINTENIQAFREEDIATGGGVGFGVAANMHHNFSAAESGSGTTRIHTLFNTTQTCRTDVSEVILWDWPGEVAQLRVHTSDGTPVPHQILDQGTHYWGHHYLRLAVCTPIPAMGYTTIIIRECSALSISMPAFLDPRCDYITDDAIILENAKLRAEFSPGTMELHSLLVKETHTELIDANHPAGSFRYIVEAPYTEAPMDAATAGMSAWRVGRYMTVENLSQTAAVTVKKVIRGELRQTILFSIHFKASSIDGSVSLDADSDTLSYNLNVDWREFGSRKAGIPHLNFHVPVQMNTEKSTCAIPLGVDHRPAFKQDVPCNGFISACVDHQAVTLMSDCKYGFRNDGHSLSVTLLRASYHPDPTPDIGSHAIRLGICVGKPSENALLETYSRFVRPVHGCSNTQHAGQLARSSSLVDVRNVQMVALKQAEDHNGLILRLYNPQKAATTAYVKFCTPVKKAEIMTICEQVTDNLSIQKDGSLQLSIPPFSLSTLRILL